MGGCLRSRGVKPHSSPTLAPSRTFSPQLPPLQKTSPYELG